jgi:hypothetical protein
LFFSSADNRALPHDSVSAILGFFCNHNIQQSISMPSNLPKQQKLILPARVGCLNPIHSTTRGRIVLPTSNRYHCRCQPRNRFQLRLNCQPHRLIHSRNPCDVCSVTLVEIWVEILVEFWAWKLQLRQQVQTMRLRVCFSVLKNAKLECKMVFIKRG